MDPQREIETRPPRGSTPPESAEAGAGAAEGEAAKPYEPNGLLRWLYRRFFAHIVVDDAWSGVVRESARRGVVVYVMRSLSLLDFLCLDFLLKRFGLPLVRFVNDLGLWILEPFGRGGRRLRFRRQIPEDRALSDVVRERYSALLFLRRPPKIGRRARKGAALEIDLIRTLVETQRAMDEPILLVPQTFVWSKLPPRREPSLVDLFFGPVEWPGRVRVFFQFLLNFRNALLRSGEPFDLQAFMADNPQLDDAALADKVRYALLRRMERERTLVLGPTKKSPTRIQDELLRSPRVRAHIEKEARTRKVSVAKVEAGARKELRRLCANQLPYMLRILSGALGWVFNRIYDGVVVDKEGLDRVRDAARDGTLVYLPSHKSHVDYLVLSAVLYRNALSAPLIAAGENLSFWPLGPILRRGGAFFIKRSFKGKKLYSVLVDAYMRRLIVEGFALEFFLEGGRSRTGKLLAPKFGLLTMVVDAALKLPMRKVYFVPVSIGYERIIEERSYVHELGGGEKQKENVGGLLKTSQVLRSKYGRLYVQFGKVLSFDEVLEWTVRDERARRQGEAPALPADPILKDGLSPAERRAVVQRVAHRASYQIDRVTVVTPAALVASTLLVLPRRAITSELLVETASTLVGALRRSKARVADALVAEDGETVRADTVEQAVQLFLDAKLVRADTREGRRTLHVPDPRRLALEYYKNNILHFFVPSALIAASLAREAGALPLDALRERVRWLSRLFKYEFMYRADAAFERIFDEALALMIDGGELVRDDTQEEHPVVRVAATAAGRDTALYATMLRAYFEAYRLAARSIGAVEGEVERRAWLKRTLALGQRLYLAGEIEHRESISKDKLEGALASFKDLGVVRFDGDAIVRGEADPHEIHDRLADLLARDA
ncbi:MAG: 1-acyl-sn-glycerol-3-phosphate acyltransferase [Myxococcales bacterium]|nr:1-acyl-sn-glycerol-3-phosphate acyltransferase [Myxococcales bacterium]